MQFTTQQKSNHISLYIARYFSVPSRFVFIPFRSSLSFSAGTERFLIRIGWDAGERGVTSKFIHLYSTTTPGEQAVYIDEQIDLALDQDPRLTAT